MCIVANVPQCYVSTVNIFELVILVPCFLSTIFALFCVQLSHISTSYSFDCSLKHAGV
jgi:hypothetical protein